MPPVQLTSLRSQTFYHLGHRGQSNFKPRRSLSVVCTLSGGGRQAGRVPAERDVETGTAAGDDADAAAAAAAMEPRSGELREIDSVRISCKHDAHH